MRSTLTDPPTSIPKLTGATPSRGSRGPVGPAGNGQYVPGGGSSPIKATSWVVVGPAHIQTELQCQIG